MKLDFRTLRADEIECRVGTANAKGFTILLYKDARVDMNILDETVGNFGWQRDHKELKGNIYCGISIQYPDTDEWITKWDCGAESNTEKEKGESSDSFKRAGFNWGIGRELYTAPFIWVNGNTAEKNGRYTTTYKAMQVSKIEYANGVITALEILGDGEIIYTYGMKKQQPTKAEETKQPTLGDARMVLTKSGKKYMDLEDDKLQYIAENSKSEYYKQCAILVLKDREEHKEEDAPLFDNEDELPF